MQNTRSKLLKITFQEMHRCGFQGMRIDVILDKVGVAKGALYHHFKDKTNLGYAVVDEVLRNLIIEKWVQPLENSSDPIEEIKNIIQSLFNNPTKKLLETGCPLNNVAQEMSSVDQGFRQRIDGIYKMWREALADALKRGQDCNLVRKDIKTEKVAAFIVASLAGCIGAGKTARDGQLLEDCGECLIDYLEFLRVSR